VNPCAICLEPAEGEYHPVCLRELFGVPHLPALDIELPKLYALAAGNMAGMMSIPGVQEKVSLTLLPNPLRLEVAATGGRYILKPETSRYPALPQNESLSMRLAKLAGIEIPPCGLMKLKDGTPAYIVRRFDRTDDGRKIAAEDFCQLAELKPKNKYDGSAELCARLVKRYGSEPIIEIRKLFRQTLFSWWIGNGDLHLKNFTLITRSDRLKRLSPAYDLVGTRLVLPEDTLALPVGGKRTNLTRRSWLDYAEYCVLPAKAAKRLIEDLLECEKPAMALVERSFLNDEAKAQYAAILRENTAALEGKE